jgi:probable rRNA maturation factor
MSRRGQSAVHGPLPRTERKKGGALPMRLEITDKQRALECPRAAIRRVLRQGLKAEGKDAELSVALVGDEEMAALHKRFLGRRRVTDVLSFPYEVTGQFVSGEIVVNAELAIREAAQRAHSAQDELLLYVAHGLLHLLGYDDHKAAERRRMREREQAILKAVGCEVEF